MSILGRLWSRLRGLVREESGADWERRPGPEPGRPGKPGTAVPPPVDSAAEGGADDVHRDRDDDEDDAVMAAATVIAHQADRDE